MSLCMKVYIKRFRNQADEPPVLDMTPEGEFRGAPGWKPPGSTTPWANKLLRYALVVAVLGGFVLVAALALWLALLMIPVVAAAAIIGYAAYHWRRYKEGR
jgi:hypothetical protein